MNTTRAGHSPAPHSHPSNAHVHDTRRARPSATQSSSMPDQHNVRRARPSTTHSSSSIPHLHETRRAQASTCRAQPSTVQYAEKKKQRLTKTTLNIPTCHTNWKPFFNRVFLKAKRTNSNAYRRWTGKGNNQERSRPREIPSLRVTLGFPCDLYRLFWNWIALVDNWLMESKTVFSISQWACKAWPFACSTRQAKSSSGKVHPRFGRHMHSALQIDLGLRDADLSRSCREVHLATWHDWRFNPLAFWHDWRFHPLAFWTQ